MAQVSVLVAPSSPAIGGGLPTGTLNDADSMYRAMFDRSPVGMAVLAVDINGAAIVTLVNAALAAVLRCSRTQLLGRDLLELTGADAATLPTNDSPAVVDRPLMLADGTEIWTRWIVTDLPARDGARTLMAQIEDVTQHRLRERQAQRQARLLELVPEPVIIRSLDGTIRYWNAGAVQVYGYSAAHATGRRTHELLATQFVGTELTDVEQQLGDTGGWSGRLVHRHADGHLLQVSSKHVYDVHDDGEPVILEINIDISDRVAAEEALKASETKFRTQFAHSTVGQLIRRPDGIIEDVNPALANMLGYGVGDLVGTGVDRLYEPAANDVRAGAIAALNAGDIDSITGEGRLVCADGSLLDVEMNISAARGADGRPAQFIGLYQDNSARKAAERALRRLALHDPLTGLPNRALFSSELDAALAHGRDHAVGLLFLDLDGFKDVNDRYGHAAGDELLTEVAARLNRCVRSSDTVARLGGDEFVILCPTLDTRQDLHRVARRALDQLARPYALTDSVVAGMTASIGLTYPDLGANAALALQQADRAMYAVKRSGKNNIASVP